MKLLSNHHIAAIAALFCLLLPLQGEAQGQPPHPIVLLETSIGDITLELYSDKAPITVQNFLDYVASGHYNETLFHRVVPDFVVQGGGFDTRMKRKPTSPPIANESENGLSNKRGTIAMARLGDPDSATSQFFINLKANKSLDGAPSRPGYAVFGKVIQGMDVVDAIALVQTHTVNNMRGVPVEPIVLEHASRRTAVEK